MAEKPRRSLLPGVWKPFNIFEEEEFFPDIFTFSNEKGLSVSEDERSVLVEAAVPGLKADDIEISIDKGTLWVKGEKSEEEKDKKRKYYRKASCSFSYCTSLPEGTDHDASPEATYEDGVVKITFKKKEASQPKKIQIKR